MINAEIMNSLAGRNRHPVTDRWISLYFWFNWYLNPWVAWSAWSAWYAWYAWSAWYAWEAWPVNWPSNWPSNYIPTHYIITATITGPNFEHGAYYDGAFKLSHTVNTGTLTVSGILQISRQGVD